jgi:hypothetical protein
VLEKGKDRGGRGTYRHFGCGVVVFATKELEGWRESWW